MGGGKEPTGKEPKGFLEEAERSASFRVVITLVYTKLVEPDTLDGVFSCMLTTSQ